VGQRGDRPQRVARRVALTYVRTACRAPSPSRETRSCGTFLGYFPGPLTLSELVRRAPDEPDGRIAVRCPRCNTWNLFAFGEPAEVSEVMSA
jgi:hypothetical protein